MFNRPRETAQEWARTHGARVASTASELARSCEIVITVVVDGAQVDKPASCAAMGRGRGNEDFCALMEALEGLAGLRL